jgi:hypothetical protein
VSKVLSVEFLVLESSFAAWNVGIGDVAVWRKMLVYAVSFFIFSIDRFLLVDKTKHLERP